MRIFTRNFWDEAWFDFIYDTPWVWPVFLVMAIPILCGVFTFISFLVVRLIFGPNIPVDARGVDVIIYIAVAIETVGLLLLVPRFLYFVVKNLKRRK